MLTVDHSIGGSMPRTANLGRAVATLEAAAQAWATRAQNMLRLAEAMRSELSGASGAKSPAIARVTAPAARTPSRVGPKRRVPKGQGVSAAVVEILRESGKPMRVNDVLAALKKRGLTVGGQKPYATLAATLQNRVKSKSGVVKAGLGLYAAGPGGDATAPAKGKARKTPKARAAAPKKAGKAAKAAKVAKKATKKGAAKKVAKRAKRAAPGADTAKRFLALLAEKGSVTGAEVQKALGLKGGKEIGGIVGSLNRWAGKKPGMVKIAVTEGKDGADKTYTLAKA
jgi:hypothetical protein